MQFWQLLNQNSGALQSLAALCVVVLTVSTLDQNESRQLEGVRLDKRFADKASGKDTKRPQLQAALDYLRDGDVLVAHSMDRLARNLDDLRRIVLGLTERGVVVEFVKEHLTFTSETNFKLGRKSTHAKCAPHLDSGRAEFVLERGRRKILARRKTPRVGYLPRRTTSVTC
jgi:DNA invertase Pin-like site-specific DNA recombinase